MIYNFRLENGTAMPIAYEAIGKTEKFYGVIKPGSYEQRQEFGFNPMFARQSHDPVLTFTLSVLPPYAHKNAAPSKFKMDARISNIVTFQSKIPFQDICLPCDFIYSGKLVPSYVAPRTGAQSSY